MTTINSSKNLSATPWQAPVSQKVMHTVEQRVIKQLLQALMFEEIIEFGKETLDTTTGLTKFSIACADGISYEAEGFTHYSFDIIKLNETDVKKVTMGSSTVASLEMVISDILLKIEGAELKDSFIKELRQTFVNDVQSSSLAENQGRAIDEMTYDELENHLMAGHPYHPCYKSRLGFSLLDNHNFGPEFEQDIHIEWLAFKKPMLASNCIADISGDEWIKDHLGDKEFQQLQDKLANLVKESSSAIEDYQFMPVHPWQWQNTLINALQPFLQTGEVLHLGTTDSVYHAQQSIRTLALIDKSTKESNKDYLKLAMHLTNTSSTRILAKHTVMNAPLISHWLKTLITGDAVAEKLGFDFLGESMGLSLDHEALQAKGYSHAHLYGGVGAMWRENVSKFMNPEQTAFPLNGVSYTRADGTHLVAPWLEKHGVENWITQLIEVTVPPLMHLLFAHGLALESHAQNIVLIHENGYPVKVLLKDLHDGVRYSPKHLSRPDLIPELHSLPAAHAALNRGSFIETDDTDGIRDMSVACLFFVAFADIAIFLQTHYQFSEADFWQKVATCIDNYQQANPEHQARYDLFDVFAPKTRIESLAKRRLFGDSAFPIKFINNPLAKTR